MNDTMLQDAQHALYHINNRMTKQQASRQQNTCAALCITTMMSYGHVMSSAMLPFDSPWVTFL